MGVIHIDHFRTTGLGPENVPGNISNMRSGRFSSPERFITTMMVPVGNYLLTKLFKLIAAQIVTISAFFLLPYGTCGSVQGGGGGGGRERKGKEGEREKIKRNRE